MNEIEKIIDNITMINTKILKFNEDELNNFLQQALDIRYGKKRISELSQDELMDFLSCLKEAEKLKTKKKVLDYFSARSLNLLGGMSILCDDVDMYNHLRTVMLNYIENNDFRGYEKDLFELMDLRKMQYILSRKSDTKASTINAKTKITSDIAKKEKDLGISMGQRQKDIQEDSYKEWVEMINRVEEFAKNHIGEFTWQCPHCQGMVLNNVPHFAFDSIVKNAVFNKEIFELIRRYYVNDNEDKYDGRLSIPDAAKILRTSCLGILAIAWERNFDLGIKYDLNDPLTLLNYVSKEEIKELEHLKNKYGVYTLDDVKTIEQKFEKITMDTGEVIEIVEREDETEKEDE